MVRRSQKRLVVFALCLCVSAWSQTPSTKQNSVRKPGTSSWKEYSYPNDGFAVSAPSAPVVKNQKADVQSGSVEIHNYYFNQSADSGFMVSVTDLGRQGIDPRTALRNAEMRTVQVVSGTVLKEQPISIGAVPGIQFEFDSKAYHSRVRYFLVKGKLIGVMSIVPPRQPLLPGTTRFLTSLRLLQ